MGFGRAPEKNNNNECVDDISLLPCIGAKKNKARKKTQEEEVAKRLFICYFFFFWQGAFLSVGGLIIYIEDLRLLTR